MWPAFLLCLAPVSHIREAYTWHRAIPSRYREESTLPSITSNISVDIPSRLSVFRFAIWAESLKKTYQLDQTALQSVGAACNIGGFAGIFSGIVYDSLEKHPKLGPRLVLLIGACANSLGYLGLWAAATR